MLKHSTWSILLLFLSVARSQFFYNYDEDGAVEPPPAVEAYDPSQYNYNSPSAVNQQFLRQSRPAEETPRQSASPRSQGRSVSRRYEPEPEYYPEPQAQPEYAPEPAEEPQRDYQQERRVSRRRQRQRSRYYAEEPTSPPRVYGPSVFENVRLGQAPSGVFVPHDSLLNTLADPAPRNQASYSPPVQAQRRNPQPEISHQSNQQPQNRFYVQPPSSEDQPRQQNVILPVVRYDENQQFAAPPAPSRRSNRRNRQEYFHQSQEAPEQHAPIEASSRQRQRPRTYPQQQPQYAPQQQTRYAPQPAPPSNNIEEFEDDLVRSRPPARAQRPNREQGVPAPRQRAQAASAATAPEARQRTTSRPARLAIAELPSDTDGDGIPGAAGVNYPTLHVIPETAFSCGQQPHNGYYADLETACQVVHMCQAGGVQSSFLCPNGTIFSQEQFSCQWWYKVKCAESPRYYAINDNLYKVPQPRSRSRE